MTTKEVSVPQVKPPKQRVRLSVRSTSGQFEDEFNLNNRVEKVLDEAVERFRLVTGGGVTYIVNRERGDVTMNPAEKLEVYELVDGDVVVIQTNQAQDG